jgi:hypothetical protein
MSPCRPLIRRLGAAAALALAALAQPGQAALLYNPGTASTSVRASDFGSSTGQGFRTFDNFTVAGGGTVQRVTWRGIWYDPAAVAPAPAPTPDVLSWDLAFHSSAGGVPVSQLLFDNLLAAEVSTTLVGSGTITIGGGGPFNVQLFEYSVDLTTPFAVASGVEYWVSLMAHSPDLYPAFAWIGATGGDNASYQQNLGPGLVVESGAMVGGDRQVILEGTLAENTVPEPGTLALALLALAGVTVLRRRAAIPRC